MKVWDGTSWLNAYASLSGALLATNNLSDLNNTATARTNLGVAIGTDVQAYDATILKSADIGVSVQGYDAQLVDIAGLTPSDNNFIVGNGTNFVTESGSTARASLGLGSIATQDANNVAITGGSISGITDLAVADGGTGASDAPTARSNLGLVIGTNVQAWDADLDTWATKTAPSGTVVGTSDSQTLTNKTISGANNTLSNIGNSSLTNSSITINGSAISLGGSVSVGTVTSVSATAGTGISISGSPITGSGTLTITNTAPDQTVGLTGGTGISISGAYPNFTITNTSTSSGGTVTSITAGTGLSGGTITTSGTIALANTSVTPGSYTNASITVDAQGRLTAASSGSGGGVTSLTAGTGISVSASTGAVTITNTSPNQLTTTTGSPAYYGARAWVNFNGTGTVSIRASVNVSSITDNGAGDYTVNFSTSMPDANYAIATSASGVTSDNFPIITELHRHFTAKNTAPTSSAFRFYVMVSGASALYRDVEHVYATVLR